MFKKISAGTLGAMLVLTAMVLPRAHGSGYIVGNGDDGSDLEGGKRITTGILIETRKKALERLRRLNTPSVDQLGMLIPELEKSDIYLIQRGIHAKTKDDRGFESSPDGNEVYARTFAEPHAATRFFPAALTLNEDQLIALHVHEALHRSLPESVRENEAVVTKITLAITADDASTDRIRRVIHSELRSGEPATTAGAIPSNDSPGSSGSMAAKLRASSGSEELPSSVTYTYRSFFIPKDQKNDYPMDSMHSLKTVIYPLGADNRAFGLGMEFSYLTTLDRSFMGPLTLSARARVAQTTNYDINAFASLSLNTMAGDEIRNSPLGRDITTLGVNFRRDEYGYYIEDAISVSLDGEAKRKKGATTQTYHYGKIIAASARAGAKRKNFELGGFAELLLSDSYVSRGELGIGDSGRFRIFAVGPELTYIKGAMRYGLSARWIVDSTPGMSLDDIGDLVGHGVGQGSISASATLRF